MPKNTSGPGSLVFEDSVSWANDAGVDTEKNLDVPLPTVQPQGAKYLVTVRNPSDTTSLTAVVKGKETGWSGADRFPELTQQAIAQGVPHGEQFVVEGWLLGDGGRIVLSNDSALGSSDGFTADVRVRRL